ncbi:hypothetical protein AYO40_05265 [Planctomycetaceae bacterium SCGC AG-212-D15]|nr:hypothetical protein AYO40_05265 [Planctomycetaceae bacterium SCGC AG-212-D15]
MSNQRPLDALRVNLIQRGLPAKYVRRVVEELEDHQQDIVDEQSITESRLGDLTVLAEQIVAEFRASRFMGRHPVMAFVVTPIPLVIVAWIGVFLGLALLSSPLEEAVGATGRNVGAYAIYLGLRFVPFAAAALLLCRSAYRSGRGRWSFVACVLVALVAGSLVANLTFSTSNEDGRLMFGTLFLTPGIVTSPLIATSPLAGIGRQLAQMAVPLAIWACFAVRFERRRCLAIRTANLLVAS